MMSKKYFYLILIFLFSSQVKAMHHDNRYFAFFERPNAKPLPSSFVFTPAVFEISGHKAGSNHVTQDISIPRLAGEYDLSTIFSNMKLYKDAMGETYTNPFVEYNHPEWEDKSVIYSIRGGILERGFSLSAEQRLNRFFSIGAFVPFMELISHHRFVLSNTLSINVAPLPEAERATLDAIRRSIHDQIGLDAPDFSHWVLGDLDCFIRAQKNWDHILLMRSIFLNVKVGCLVPVGSKRQIDNPASLVPMNDGHWGFYFELNPEFELKQNLFVGALFGVQVASSRLLEERIPITPVVSAEMIRQNKDLPFMYSPATGLIRRHKGATVKVAPYITLANVVDGLSAHFRWDFIHHFKDKYKDYRPTYEKTLVPSNFETMKEFSEFTINSPSFEIEYDSKKAFKKWPFEPLFFMSFGMPLAGQDNAVKQHQYMAGIQLRF